MHAVPEVPGLQGSAPPPPRHYRAAPPTPEGAAAVQGAAGSLQDPVYRLGGGEAGQRRGYTGGAALR